MNTKKLLTFHNGLKVFTALILIYPIGMLVLLNSVFFFFAMVDLITGEDLMSNPLAVLIISGVAIYGTYALVMTLFSRKSNKVMLGLVAGLILYVYVVITFPDRPIGLWNELVLIVPILLTITHICLIITHRFKNNA